MALDISLDDSKQGALRVALNGSLDSETAPQLSAALGNIDDSVSAVVFDMKSLEFISSAGLRVIFTVLKAQKSRGGRVAVSNMSPGVKKVFEIVKALPDMTVFANDQEMDDYLASFQRGDD